MRNFVEKCYANKMTNVTHFKLVCYLALVGKSPDSSCNLNGKYDKQEEEELQQGEIKLNSADCVNVACLNACVCACLLRACVSK